MLRRLGSIIAVLALAAAACGGESEIEVYFDGLGDVTAAYAAEVQSLPLASTAGTLEDARAFFSGVRVTLETALADLAGLVPPEAAADAHDGLADTMNRFFALAEQTATRAAELQSADELRVLATDPVVGVANFGAAEAQLVDACEELQALADAEEIDVDLGCAALNPSGR